MKLTDKEDQDKQYVKGINAITKHVIKKFEERLLKNVYDNFNNIENVKQQNCEYCKKIIFTDDWIPICNECEKELIK